MMNNDSVINTLLNSMILYNEADPLRIQHSVKVHSFAKLIAENEKLPPETVQLIEIAAILHDVGIRAAEKKYGHQNGKLQEQEGPAVAENLMRKAGVDNEELIGRVKYLIGHHHTYTNDTDDYQILVEADFLVNLFEDNEPVSAVKNVRDRIFKTASGIKLIETMYGI
jgi:uncharacterized protein